MQMHRHDRRTRLCIERLGAPKEMIEDQEILDDFVVESLEHLSDVESLLLEIEGESACNDTVNNVFRAVHSVKGAAGFLGLTTINELSHKLENVLNLIRNQELIADSAIVDQLLRSSDQLRGLIEEVGESNSVNVSAHLVALEAIENGEAGSGNNDGSLAQAPAEEPTTTNDAATSDSAVSPATDTLPDPPTQATTAQNIPAPTQQPASTSAAKATEEKSAESKPATGKSGSKSNAESNVRVNVSVLDQLMNLAGELVLGRNQLLQSVADPQQVNLESVASRLDQVTTELQESIMQTRMQPVGSVFNKFNRMVRDLCSKLGKEADLEIEGKDVEVDKTIIEAIGDPLTHLVRNSLDHGIESPEARKSAGKSESGTLRLRAFHASGKVTIEITDDGKGIDASILREKAVEKGIMDADAAGRLSDNEAVRLIFHPGFSTAAEVTDVSGRGVGMDVVRSNIEKIGGAIDIETEVGRGTSIIVSLPLTLAIVPSLIVSSGRYKVAVPQVNIAELVRIRCCDIEERIGNIKGREVLRLRGSLLPLIDLDTVLGGKHKNAPNDEEAEPSTDVPSIEPERESVNQKVDSPEDLSEESPMGRKYNIVVVESGSMRFGLVVSELFDSEEIVVKPLGKHLREAQCLSGATILGDGSVALILDVAGIAVKADLRLTSGDCVQSETEESSEHDSASELPILLFRNHPDEQFALPMETISRIERIRCEQINRVGDNEILQYAGGILPLASLESLVKAQPRQELPRLYVIVLEAASHEFGIVVSELVDIRTVRMQLDTSTFKDDLLIGSQVIDERTTRLLNSVQLTKRARPDWYDAAEQARKNRGSDDDGNTNPRGKILLAEDSMFFRKQVTGFLRNSGLEVDDHENGQAAWAALARNPEDYSMVLTDIEMPEMDGLELTRKIRSEDRFAQLPIVALTSLASEADTQRGYDAGVTEYQVKLDREQLIASVLRHVPRK